jgi:hypothetical protein
VEGIVLIALKRNLTHSLLRQNNNTRRILMTYSLQILSEYTNNKLAMNAECRRDGITAKRVENLRWKILSVRNRSIDLGLVGRIILKWIIKKLIVTLWTGFI